MVGVGSCAAAAKSCQNMLELRMEETKHRVVLELKLVRDRGHGKKVGDELIIDIEHYRHHPGCEQLWCVVYDPNHFIPNPQGLVSDLQGTRKVPDGDVDVRVFVLSG